MHADLLPDLAERLRNRATNVAWTQWATLGSGAVAPRPAVSVVDPEALVLASLALVGHERQLADLLAWWAARGSGLLSVQRTRNLADRFPALVGERLKEFAAYARAGGDHRWKGVASGAEVGAASTSGGDPRLAGPAAVLLRLRLGLGVGIKADLVAALVGAEGWWTVRELSASTAYTTRAVRRAAEELALGGWIRASPASPTEYRARPERWLPLLELESPAPWRDWARQFALVAAVDGWIRAGEWRGQDLADAERSARRLLDAHRGALKWSGVSLPPPVSRPGAEYIRAFAEAVLGVARRMEEEV